MVAVSSTRQCLLQTGDNKRLVNIAGICAGVCIAAVFIMFCMIFVCGNELVSHRPGASTGTGTGTGTCSDVNSVGGIHVSSLVSTYTSVRTKSAIGSIFIRQSCPLFLCFD